MFSGERQTHCGPEMMAITVFEPVLPRPWAERTKPRRWFPAVTYAWLGITVVAFSISHWRFLAWHREPSETARYLFEHSAPEDRVFIWDRSAAEVYLHARGVLAAATS
jgi:hypothetical protein